MGRIVEAALLDFSKDGAALVVSVGDRGLVYFRDPFQWFPAPLAVEDEPYAQLLTVHLHAGRHLVGHGFPSIQRSMAARL
ncbi:hypothetical protein D3C81_2108890 [compost metagenome]